MKEGMRQGNVCCIRNKINSLQRFPLLVMCEKRVELLPAEDTIEELYAKKA
jgi:hypothetical protein